MTVTSNRSLLLPVQGVDVLWGTLLNNGVMSQLDLILGATAAVAITVADVTLTQVQWNNVAVKLTGALTGNRNLILPLNPNSATVAVGGLFVVDNETSGAFNITVKTVAVGSTGVIVPQGLRTLLYSDGTNVYYADDSSIKLQLSSGSPTGQLAGTQGSVNAPPSFAFDYTNGALYVCTTTGSTSTAVWTNIVAAGAALPAPQGYLTPVTNQPIITGDSIAATAIYYTPFVGGEAVAHNGTGLIPYQFSQMQLTLTASQAASQIYDIFLAYNGGTPVIGTGPSWTSGGGSVTAGSCARGTGAGSTALTRLNGVYVNQVSMSLIYNTGAGNNTITVPANQGVYLGSIFIDSVAGQVTCHRNWGQSRKWGIWNAYNRVPVYLKAGDSTASWANAVTTLHPSNANTANSLTVFSGLSEDVYDLKFIQNALAGGATTLAVNAIGVNSTLARSGFEGIQWLQANNEGITQAQYQMPPALGINTITALEATSTNAIFFLGTEANMILSAQWRA